VASLVFDAGGLGHEAGGRPPPSASPAPMLRRRARHWYSALGSGFQCGQPSRPTAGDGRAVRVLARTDGTAQIRPSRPSL